jgi:hypothetical protein
MRLAPENGPTSSAWASSVRATLTGSPPLGHAGAGPVGFYAAGRLGSGPPNGPDFLAARSMVTISAATWTATISVFYVAGTAACNRFRS